ncbi:PLP-dependent aminotransferase family protein [Hyphomicrobium facile]|uniref:DNA-binding transcriptional regulator, MocR family, contains an aminotransferase domain n=1 Tax=Hyphomicrobium facile TaxID=51670 RepID=A0A1I7NL85_9HYPH|nr:PLP-dependent aminotransferase family protein [Hyphomicrobium facile]SFV35424.1 DNA-binding transcriptional regulator, MocR family, contains an aminotransferase domain [Hyphomicrobium facile]
MSSWEPWLAAGGQLKYRGIVEAIEIDLKSGRIQPGDRLPPQRMIAEILGVDLTTVTRAFNEARRRGLVEANAGRGTFIRRRIDDGRMLGAASTPAVDLSMNIPPQPAAANLKRLIPETIANLLSEEGGMLNLHYQESTGSESDRAAAAVWLRQRIPDVKPASIVLTNGAQNALFAICECLASPGDSIAAGFVTYPGLKAIAQQRGFRLRPLEMDEQGIDPQSFEACCATAPPKLLYVIPAIDNPTTATLSEERRHEIVAIARRYNVTIIEDDPYSSLQSDPLTPIAALAPDITWHIATLSKCASPALRIAYVVAPSAAEATRLAAVIRAVNLMVPPLNAALASRWIATGILDDVALAIREENIARQKLAKTALGGAQVASDKCASHIWMRMPPQWRATNFVEHAGRLGISVVPGAAFAIGPKEPEALRLSLGVAPDRDALLHALKQLAVLLSQPPGAAKAIV